MLDRPLVFVDLETTGVPLGTNVEVTIKPHVGGVPLVATAPLEPPDCDSAGMCAVSVAVNLTPGGYVIEARATFEAF